jgi:hypothetical protein
MHGLEAGQTERICSMFSAVALALALFLEGASTWTWAQSHSSPSDAQNQTVELGADVIEVEKGLPTVFSEFDSIKPTADSVIYRRTDFNDLRDGTSFPLRFQPRTAASSGHSP